MPQYRNKKVKGKENLRRKEKRKRGKKEKKGNYNTYHEPLRKTLVFTSNGALRAKFNFYFQGFFASIKKIFILEGRRCARL